MVNTGSCVVVVVVARDAGAVLVGAPELDPRVAPLAPHAPTVVTSVAASAMRRARRRHE
jgi:hypothetical protein